MNTSQELAAEVANAERRNSVRREVATPIRVQPMDPTDRQFDEITTSLNNARNGIAFPTRLTAFYIGMLVRVTYPFTATVKVNHVGRVIRIEKLDANFQRIVVQLN